MTVMYDLNGRAVQCMADLFESGAEDIGKLTLAQMRTIGYALRVVGKIARLEAVATAANDFLSDLEVVETPSGAKLVLALYDLDPQSVGGKEHCRCEDPDACDECLPVDLMLTALRQKAAEDNV